MKTQCIMSLGLLAATALATDPPAPPGGFPITTNLDVPIVYSDGYRTRLDVRYPSVAPPATGWPCLVVVHGAGGSRKRGWVVSIAEQMAAAGYLTLAYDTGGNGVTQVLNPPGPRGGPELIRDLSEIFFLAEQSLGATLDETRLAVKGKSGGGRHALWAASYSGLPLPLTGYLSTMPPISAIHTDIQTLDPIEDRLPQGTMVTAKWAVDEYQENGAGSPIVQLMRNGNYAALAAAMQTSAGLNYFPLLQQSEVPMLVSYAYDDANHFVNDNPDQMARLRPDVPRRYFLGTGGHGSAQNNGVGSFRTDLMRRWFDRFLKGIQNGVLVEPAAEIAMIPEDVNDYLNNQTEWKHRRSATWPNPPTQVFYLREAGRLDTAPPTTVETGPVLEHRVAPGYDLIGFMQDNGGANVLNSIPLVTVSFDTPVVSAPQEILGRTVVELDVINSAINCQMQAALLDVPPTGPARFITSGAAALRNAIPGRHRLRIELGDVGYQLQPGHKLRLSLENLNLRRQPGHPDFHAVPDFDDCDLDVQIDPAFAPRMALPIGPAQTSVTPRLGRVSAGAGFNHDLHLDGEANRAGAAYQLLIGASGNAPGFSLWPAEIPLNFDNWTSFGLLVGNAGPVFQSFVGTLDANGEATASFSIPPALAPLVIGTRFNFAVLGIDNLSFFSSNPAELIIEP